MTTGRSIAKASGHAKVTCSRRRKAVERRGHALTSVATVLSFGLFLHRMGLQILQRNEFERGDVGARENHGRSHAGVERLFPPRHAEAPAVARFEAGKLILWNRRAQVVAHRAAEGEEFGGDLDANGVETVVAGAGAAIAGAMK